RAASAGISSASSGIVNHRNGMYRRPMFDTLFDPARLRRKPVDGSFWLYYAFILMGCIAIQLSDLSIGRWGRDAQMLELAVETGGRLGASSLGDYAVTALGPYLGIPQLPNLVPTIALVFVISRISYQGSTLEKIAILFLSFPTIFQLQFVSKEGVVTLFIISTYFVMNALRQPKYRLIYIIGVLGFMAAFFRNYYVISLAFALLVVALKKPRLYAPAIILGLLAASLIPQVRDRILDARYLVYRNVSIDAASLIPMNFHGYDPVSFLGNYFFSIPFYCIPFLLNFRVQELYMQIYIVCSAVLISKAMRYGERGQSAVLLGVVCTFPVFVAEVGTLARHLSGIIPLGYMSIYFSQNGVCNKRSLCN
ncbi:hypothetical protein VPH46_16295, partial [Sphingomonas sp. MJ1 (PH-R8)]|uniref:hypothetical protein n=1 Tax=Sphingomonas sp. MJ1 (PH-R8) TaxID=3112950 RepID=UPI003A88CD3E